MWVLDQWSYLKMWIWYEQTLAKFVYKAFADDVIDSFVWNTNMAAMAFVELVHGEWVQTLYPCRVFRKKVYLLKFSHAK
jgi:hypothetical protein